MNPHRNVAATVLASAAVAIFAGCSAPATPSDLGTTSSTEASSERLGTLVVGATATPAGEILQFVIDSGQDEAVGLDLEVTEFTDYSTPNPSLSEGSTDANLFQHEPFLDIYNENSGDDLTAIGQIYLPPLALYSKTVTDINDLEDGASIAVPNDASNEGRSLLLLAESGLIETNDAPTTLADITSNPRNFEFLEIDAASLPAALEDQDAAIVNFNYAAAAGLTGDLQIVTEGTDSIYFNVLATRAELVNDPRISALYELLNSQETKDFLAEQYSGLVIPAP